MYRPVRPSGARTICAALAAATIVAVALPAQASHSADEHTDNIERVGSFDHGDTYRQGSDLAFWGNVAVLGNYAAPGGFRLLDISVPSRPRLLGQLECPGPQGDVSIWRDLVFVSVDSARTGPECGAGAAPTTQFVNGESWEGIRIVSIADRAKPTQIAAVETDCGSHTHTLVPDPENDRVLIYVLSYPLGAPAVDCNVESHRKISVIEVPLDQPAKARVVTTPDVSPAIGCHDVTVFLEVSLAAAACISETQMWDISDPANPTVLSHIRNPAINIHHSTTFAWDGDTIAIGDELGGAAASPGCIGEGHLPLGAIWFYDVSEPDAPVQRGWFTIPQRVGTLFCTAHNFNTIPLRDDRDLLVSGWYNGGTTVIDFTDPSKPKQVAYYIPKEDEVAASWSSYWYNGYIYSNNFDEDVNSVSAQSRGFDVFRLTDDTAKGAARVPYLNPQTQESAPAGARGTKRSAEVLGTTFERTLPRTGVPAAWPAALGLVAAALGARRLRRTRI